MENTDWAKRDYEIAREYIEDHEETASTTPVLDCGQEVTAVLPLGVPALGFRLHGLIMLAPLPLLMLCGILFPIFGFMRSWQVSLTTLSITAGCAIMVLGLFRVICLVVGQRETFPRQYFATLGPKGVAMHFARFQFPLGNPQKSLSWKQVDTIRHTRAFFLPGLLVFKPFISVIRAESKDGSNVLIPTPANPELQSKLKNRLENSSR